ncbi:hypothetical protein LOD44_04880 [Xylella fastidiosa subsp. multiplex]|uniref:hypothetical protein n=1 Tax=Xylella fastidiosa TaxID=2371 RepID=UPI0000459424|nr:hypothetical protein [Xylella fastidiosa]MDC6410857.1 hypothetical protein [Xylella fastidiosa subsp. multiplex]MDD0860714.1 hypothetical protein [Xylella fastidiosa subsp. multiplex]MDD0867460.1 hypothetical protein [Xylella fastidiosa subsp. multiplex]MDD0904596.1 hypothetical protein [Xylella fastidiosa subsp. multiplex]MDD0906787.1 hypothetical protein [Xylella fastidiosa subsp. multiplex]
MDPLHDPRNAAQITPTTGNIAPYDALERHPHCNRRVSPNQTHLGNNHTETPVLKHSK